MEAQSAQSTGFDPRSGHGEASTIPEEIKRWSWGAFFLSWIWGIGNRTWMSLIVFVPLVNVVAPIILGLKGNEWAWKSKSWPSVDEFHKTQKKWALAGVIVFGASLAIAIGAIVLVLMFGKPVTPSSESMVPTWEQESDSEFESMFDEEMMEPQVIEWKSYDFPEEEFSIDFPQQPDQENGSYENPDGEQVLTTIHSADEETTGYFVAIEQFSEELSTSPEADVIARFRESLSNVEKSIEGASIASTEPTTFMGAPALRYLMMIGADRVEEGIFVQKGSRIYTAAAEYDAGSKPAEFEAFQSSFELK
ncbi:hypothetical protein KBC59_00345 [Patescibacteria group bacterium]|jgi:hypothetical protein|nr:hypothetical protein [Patescibacteria group bacterium]